MLSTILAIEMSQGPGTVAVHSPNGRITESSFSPELTSDLAIFDCLDKVFEKTNIGIEKLDYIAVSRGPGGFTGLRIAATFASMASLVLGVDLLEVPSGIVPVMKYMGKKNQILVVASGKRDDAWYTRCCYKGGIWRVAEELLVNKNTLNDFVQREDQLLLADNHMPDSHRSFFDSLDIDIETPTYSAGWAASWAVAAVMGGIITPSKQKIKICYPRKPESTRRFQAQ